MAAYAEGFNILKNANVGRVSYEKDAETTPLRNPAQYQYDLDLADIAELWRRGSVVTSWLLDLTAQALVQDPELETFEGQGVRFRRGTLDGGGSQRPGRSRERAARGALRAASPLAGTSCSRTRCSRPCASASAATWRRSRDGGRVAASVRRLRLLRGDRRPRLQEDLPGSPGTVPARKARRPGRRCGEVGLQPGAAPRAGRASLTEHGGGSTSLRSRASRRTSVTWTATTTTPRPSAASGPSWGAQRAPPTTWPSRPACFRRWRGSSGRAGCTAEARVIVEKPFGRDLASARCAQPDPARGLPRGEHLPDRPLPRQGSGAEHPLLPLRQRVPGAHLQPALRRERPDHDGRELRGDGARQVLRGDRRHPRRDPEPPAPGRQLPGHGSAVRHLRGGHPGRAGQGSADDPAARRREMVRGQFRGYRDEPGVEKESYMATYAALRLQVDFVAVGRACPSTCGPASASRRPPPRSSSSFGIRRQVVFTEPTPRWETTFDSASARRSSSRSGVGPSARARA